MTQFAHAHTTDATDVASADESPMFYVVSKRKLIVLYLFTFGLYSLYWFYKQWDGYRDKVGYESDRGNIWPVMRAIFSIFFTHSLFREIKAYGDDKPQVSSWGAETNATFLVLALVGQTIVSRMGDYGIGVPLVDYLLLLSFPVVALVMAKVQKIINIACGDPEAERNREFSGANYAWMTGGFIVWCLALVGMFMAE